MFISSKREIRDASDDALYYIGVARASADKAAAFLDALRMRGIKYFLSLKMRENLENPVYLDLCDENIKRASAAVIVLDDAMLSDPDFLAITMYECGLVMAGNSAGRKKLFLIDGGISPKLMSEVFNHLPVRSVQLSTFDAVVAVIDEYRVLPKNFFDLDTNRFSNPRIFYVQMDVMMQIRYGSLKRVCDRYQDEDEVTVDEILDDLEKYVSTGLTFFHFEKEEHRDHPSLWPYRKEMAIVCRDFPVRNVFNKVKLCSFSAITVETDPSDIVATLKMEFIFPNNEVLGTTFKPFMQVEGNKLVAEDLAMMLTDDGVRAETVKKVRENGKTRVYYPLNVDDRRLECEVSEELAQKYGRKANYVFPK